MNPDQEVLDPAAQSRENRREMAEMLALLVSVDDQPQGALTTQVAWWSYWASVQVSMRSACQAAVHLHDVQAIELRARMMAEFPQMRQALPGLLEELRTRDLVRLLRSLREMGEEPDDPEVFPVWCVGKVALLETLVTRLGEHRQVWEAQAVKGRARTKTLIRGELRQQGPEVKESAVGER